MDAFSYFHLCDHRIKKKNEGELKTLAVRSGGKQINPIINGAVILGIEEVRVVEYDSEDAEIQDFFYDRGSSEDNITYDDEDPGEGYYDFAEAYIIDYSKYFDKEAKVSRPIPTHFYEPFLHNRIRWLVKPPLEYLVTVRVKYTNVLYEEHRAENCPICEGKGWFIDILNKDGEFEQPKGIFRIAQRIVKDLLTEKGSHMLDNEYGTEIKQELAFSSNDEDLFSFIRMTVSDVEDRYLSDQQERINELEDNEILSSLVVEDVRRSVTNPTIIILKLRITTPLEEQIFQLGI